MLLPTLTLFNPICRSKKKTSQQEEQQRRQSKEANDNSSTTDQNVLAAIKHLIVLFKISIRRSKYTLNVDF
jgi:hypothetical protein